MSPAELKTFLTSIAVASNVIEAIDDTRLQHSKGWDLTGWHYELVPWGVRFFHADHQESIYVFVSVFL